MPTFLRKDPTRRWVLIEPPLVVGDVKLQVPKPVLIHIPQVRQERAGKLLLWGQHYTLEELRAMGYKLTTLKSPVLIEDRRP